MNHTFTLALLSAAVLGFRHGFDYDHVAAISDIASLETAPRRAARMGMMYFAGHAATVGVLAAAVIALQKQLPAQIDRWCERAVGLTLVALAVYVIATLARPGAALPKSRASLLIGAWHWLRNRFHGHSHATVHTPTTRSFFTVGIIHGLGAETPSQILLFLLAANLGGPARAFAGLALFLAGLLAMNTLMTASAVGIFGATARRPGLLRVAIGLTAAYSLAVGIVFLL